MIHHHRNFELKKNLIGRNPAESGSLREPGESEHVRSVTEGKTTPLTHESVRKEIEEKHGPSVYRKSITDYVSRFAQGNEANAIIQNSVESYGTTYESEMRQLSEELSEVQQEYDEDIQEIQEETQRTLYRLRRKIPGRLKGKEVTETRLVKRMVRETWEAGKAEEALDKGLSTTPKEGEVQNLFDDYIDELNDRYFDSHWARRSMERIPENQRAPLTKEQQEGMKYEREGSDFENDLQNRMEEKIAQYFKSGVATPESLKGIKKEIALMYHAYASLDGDPSSISLADVQKMEPYKETPSDEQLSLMINNPSDQELLALQVLYLRDFGEWEDLVEGEIEKVMEKVRLDASEEEFLEVTNKILIGQGKKPVQDLEGTPNVHMGRGVIKQGRMGAEKAMHILAKEQAVMGVGASLQFLDQVKSATNYLVSQAVKDSDPVTKRYYAETVTVDGRFQPESRGRGGTIARFLKADEDGRKAMLSSGTERDRLFHAIREVQVGYRNKIENEGTSDEDGSVDKRTAQMQTLILMADEAERIIINYGKKHEEYKGEDMKKQLHAIEGSGEIAVEAVLKKPRGPVRGQSVARRGGWNARDMLVKAIKIGAAGSALLSTANSLKDVEVRFIDDPVGFLMEGAEKTITNPSVIVSSAVMFGTYKLESNPQFFNFFNHGEYGRRGMFVNMELNAISDSMGTKRVKKFIHDQSEWEAMTYLAKEEKVSSMLETAQDEERDIPVITRQDLKDAGVPAELLDRMHLGDMVGDHMRYEFYRRLLTSKGSLAELRELKAMCMGNPTVKPLK